MATKKISELTNVTSVKDTDLLLVETSEGTRSINKGNIIPVVPTKLSELAADSTHRLVTDTEKSTWNSKADASTVNSLSSTVAGKANSSHNQAASTITAGTFAGNVVAPASTTYTTNIIRNGVFTTTDPGAGVSTSHANGSIIYVYE